MTISLAWSTLADVPATGQAKRTFALIASGASIGGLTGPIVGAVLVAPIGHAGLLLLSAIMLMGSAAAIWLHRWRDYRGGDAVSGWLKSGIDLISGNPMARWCSVRFWRRPGASAVFSRPPGEDS